MLRAHSFFIKPPLTPVAPKVSLLTKKDFVVSQKAQEEMGVDPETYCAHVNQGWQGRIDPLVTKIDLAKTQDQLLYDFQNIIHETRQTLERLRIETGRIHTQVICEDTGNSGEKYVRIEPHGGILFPPFTLEILTLAPEQTMGNPSAAPIEALSLEAPLGFTDGQTLYVNEKPLPLGQGMTLRRLTFLLGQHLRGVAHVHCLTLQEPMAEESPASASASGRPGLYKLSVKPMNPSKPIVFRDESAGEVLRCLGLSDERVPLASGDAVFKVDGMQMTRSLNKIENIFPGLSLKLLSPTGGAVLKISSAPAVENIKQLMSDLLESFRVIQRMVAQSLPIDGESSIKHCRFLLDLSRELGLSSDRSFGASIPARTMGIDRQGGVLLFQHHLFDQAVQDNPAQVKNFFRRTEEVDLPDMLLIKAPKAFVGEIQVQLSKTAGHIKGFLSCGKEGLSPIEGRMEGTILYGPRGHPLEKLEIVVGPSVRDSLKEGDPIVAIVTLGEGFLDFFDRFLDAHFQKMNKERECTDVGLKKTLAGLELIQKESDKKKKELKEQSANLQAQYGQLLVTRKIEENMMKTILGLKD
jgi:hypothetical protein